MVMKNSAAAKVAFLLTVALAFAGIKPIIADKPAYATLTSAATARKKPAGITNNPAYFISFPFRAQFRCTIAPRTRFALRGPP